MTHPLASLDVLDQYKNSPFPPGYQSLHGNNGGGAYCRLRGVYV